MLFASLTSWADNATYYVSEKDGNDSADGLSPTASLKTLASFVGDAGAAKLQNATVVLSPGVYAVEETLTLKNGVLRSAEGTSPEEVVLDGGNTCQVVYADKGELSGLTICNGVSDETSKGATGGGGIYATGSIISNCIVRNCNASYAGSSSQVGGGGIHVEWGRVLDSVVSNCSFTVDNAGVYGAGGGVCTFYTAIVKGNMIADCRSVSKAAKRCGGGGLAMFGDLLSCVTEDNTIEGCSVVNTAGDPAGYGGGVFIDDAINGHLEDFMIRGCRADNGGGVFLRTKGCSVIASTISNNTASVNGGGVYVMAHGGDYGACAAFTNCLIAANVSQTQSLGGNGKWDGNCGGGGVYVAPSPSAAYRDASRERVAFSGCAILGNKAATKGGGICYDWYRGENAVIAGCVIADNVATNSGGGVYSYGMHNGTIRNAIFLRNCAKDGAAVTHQASSAKAGENWRMSNCYVTGNDCTQFAVLNMCGSANGGNYCIIEHSTVVSNNCAEASKSCYALDYRNYAVSNVYIEACVVYGNGSNGNNNIAYASGHDPLHVTRTYANNVPYGDGRGNISPATILPDRAFVSPSGGDWRLRRRNALVDAGSTDGSLNWMRSALDLGDGTYELSKVRNHGVCILLNKPNRRWCGEAPDVGCFELKCAAGFCIFCR